MNRRAIRGKCASDRDVHVIGMYLLLPLAVALVPLRYAAFTRPQTARMAGSPAFLYIPTLVLTYLARRLHYALRVCEFFKPSPGY